ncbi:GNAT family N-acetyltransferase [Methylorubrum populi]
MSGADPLDRYFRTQAGQDIGKRVASCFVLTESEGGAPIGFYTLAATSIALANLSPTLAKRLPRYPILPAALLGRLALNNNYQRRGLGQLLLMDAFIRTLRSEIAIFAFVVNAKDNNAKNFYEAHGFVPLRASSRYMFMPMSEVAKLFV